MSETPPIPPSETNETATVAATPLPPVTAQAAPGGFFDRLKHHKVMQWTLAYAAAAYTLLHGTEMVSSAFSWPELIVRLVTVVLALGVPVAAVLAWYHGARAQHRVSGPELTIITLLLVLVGTALWALTRTSADHAAPAVTATVTAAPMAVPAAAPAAPRTSVAVLPFANLTGDASKDYLGDGMAEEIINTLTKVPELKVPARTSSFAYKGRNTDIRQIAKDLGVGTILEGSVQTAGTQIRISAELINAQDGLHLWSETYDEPFSNLFALQDKLATAIAMALQPSLTGSSIAQAPPTRDVEAYDLYLQGWSLVSGGGDPPSDRRAIEYFNQAIARDPKFARAYAGIAAAYFAMTANDFKPYESLGAAERAAQQALALDANQAQAHSVLAAVSLSRGNPLEMESQDRAGQALAPNDGFLRATLGAELLAVGHLRESLKAGQESYALAPANPLVLANLANDLSTAGRDAEALHYVSAAVDLGFPKSIFTSISVRTALRSKRYAEAAALSAQTPESSDPDEIRAAEIEHLTYAALENPTLREAALAARKRLYPASTEHGPGGVATTDARPCLQSSLMYGLLGALDDAFELANQCLSNLAPGAVRLYPRSGLIYMWSPELRPFRQDRRFQALAARLGLMAYWQQYGPPDDCDLKDGKLTCH
jgi:TolB-like protein